MMYKYIVIGFLISTLLFCTSSCGAINNNNTVSSNMNQNITQNNEITTLEELKNCSDACVYISTCKTYEVKNENNKIYSKVRVIPVTLWQCNFFADNITIIEHIESYLEPERVYIVFLSESEEDNDSYYLSCGKSSIFSVNGDVKPLDYKLKREVETHWGNKYENFEVWFNTNYSEPPQTTTENTATININTTSNNS